MDGRCCNQTSLVKEISNVSIIKLPPCSSDLNPLEQVQNWLRQHHLANKRFSSYENIANACSTHWNDFISDIQSVFKIRHHDAQKYSEPKR
jgi:transposase